MKKRMKMNFLGIMICTALVLGFTSCNDDDDEVKVSRVNIEMKIPAEVKGVTITSGKLTFKNVSTGMDSVMNYTSNPFIELTDGLYNVTFVGEGTQDPTGLRSTGNNIPKVRIQGIKENVTVTGGILDLELDLVVSGFEQKDFVIAEIYAVGTYSPGTTKQYNGDQYFRIHNNSDEVLYADGLVLLESKFTTSSKYDYKPDKMSEAMTVQVVARIPGDGTQYPVEPGKSIVICDNALNHAEVNSNSFDLSHADFEWFTSSSTSTSDIDNPDVPNLEMMYNYTKTVWVLTKQGNRTYAIGRLPEEVTPETYLSDYTYDYTYIMVNGKESKVFTEYYFPNSWIVDAVNLGAKNAHVWNLVAPSLDMGFASFGENSATAENLGKAIVRKITYEGEDKIYYLDTNNSTADFVTIDAPTLKK